MFLLYIFYYTLADLGSGFLLFYCIICVIKLVIERKIRMEHLLYVISTVYGKIKTVSDLFWDFPTNFEWYSNIPILGNFSLAIILLVGSGIYFTIRLRFVQVRKFKRGIEVLKNSKAQNVRLSVLFYIELLPCYNILYKN